jgi:nucleoside recognition membrane protein YjiH
VRAYLLAFGLTSLMIGLPLLLAGEVGIGCTVTTQGASTVYSDCAGAQSLIFGGAVLVVAAVVFFAGMFVPAAHSQYK